MRRKIPSTAALEAFEAAARHQSYTRAADELALTQSAVCRQIASLESFLGVRLFRRSRRGVLLTDAGADYARQVRRRLDEVERDTRALMARGDQGGSLELGVVPTFATRWLLPRLAGFQRAHPGITVHLTPRTRPFLFDETTLDAAIQPGTVAWPGTESRFLMHEDLIAVASPSLLAAVGPPDGICPAQLAAMPLLQPSTRPYAWRQWFASLGLRVEHDLAGPRMELFSMLSEAAAQGLGVALVPQLLVEDDLASGRLQPVWPHKLRSELHYALLIPEGKADQPALQAFAGWLEDEARRYRDATGDARGDATADASRAT